ncbi:hypothetical protein DUI87_02587 [Hirundo rustica rustica]|uniref:RNase H type-1 domain-containing protein n=1 Tax=Hirundo rustica rustica TaxID=333673 RepID=A0A3M0L8J0_HIRRU|nr:hypothetical protein DUI87_02587 [Hirundo rustica rustica]
MESRQAHASSPPKRGEQQAQLDVTCLSLAKGRRRKGPTYRKFTGFYMMENLFVKVRHVDAHVPKSQATKEHQKKQKVDQAAKNQMAQVDLDWQHKEVAALLIQDKCGEIPTEVENAVNPVVWAGDIPGRSKWAEPVSIALKPGATLDGSSFIRNGQRVTVYAVTTQDKVIKAKALPRDVSSQKGELIALMRALDLSERKKVNIWTDSEYAFSVVHAHGAIWKERGLLNAQGN